MVRKVILVLLTSFAIVMLLLIGVKVVQRQKKMAPIRTLPALELLTLDSTACNLLQLASNGLPTVLVAFHPECEYCAMEALEVLSRYDSIAGANLLFITYAPLPDVEQFVAQYPLQTLDNVRVLLDPYSNFFTVYNISAPPMCFLYDVNLQLVLSHKGAFTVDQLNRFIERCHE